jgi:hypothetical protein
MKTKISYSLLAAALACGMAQGQTTAYTTPVGYETLPVSPGFNYLGLRMHGAPVAAGTFDSNTSTTLVDNQANFSLTAGTLYLLELSDGMVIEILGSSFSGTTVSGLTGITATQLGQYTVRPAATLASVFGAENSAGLAAGSFGNSGADQIWVPDGSGDFNRYYYDTFNPNTFLPTWSDAEGSNAAVDPTTIPLVYLDGILLVKDSGSPLTGVVVSGTVKTTDTLVGLPAGFNYVSSLYPVGATIASSYGIDNSANFNPGSFGNSGADQIWIPDGSGDFNRYYYDSFNPNTFTATWSDAEGSNAAVDATAIDLTNGLIIVTGSPVNAGITAPSFYSNL